MKKSSNPRRFNTRLALGLFAVYGLVYLAFVLANGFAPATMEWKPAQGVNLAVGWGLGLIGLAFLEAIIYGWYCKPETLDPNEFPSFQRTQDVASNRERSPANPTGKEPPP